MKKFNTTAVCIPSKHYMVDLSERVKEIRKLVDAGEYFTINRARQYGKTTTINALKNELVKSYTVVSLDFQSLDKETFANGTVFSQAFTRLLLDLDEYGMITFPSVIRDALTQFNKSEVDRVKMDDLFRTLRRWIGMADGSFYH